MVVIQVEIKNDQVFSLSFTGHSEWAESGKDIVCSAISTLLQTLEIGITEVLQKGEIARETGDDPYNPLVKIWTPFPYGTDEAILIDTVMATLRKIENSYPENVRLTEVRI